MPDIEIGSGKSGRIAYSLSDISIVPSRRTRDVNDVEMSWSIEAYRFPLPFMAAPSDAIVSPDSAAAVGALGGLAVLNLEGLWTRYESPQPLYEAIKKAAESSADAATRLLQELYLAPIVPSLVSDRIREVAAHGVVTAGALSPQRTAQFAKAVVEAELDLLVIQGTVVSAEHLSRASDPLDLKRFIREYDIPVIVGGCASYPAALHLMRTGAVGVLVGVGEGQVGSARGVLGLGVPQATAIADVAGARSRHLEETGVYVHVIADGGISTSGDIARAIACGADAVMVGAPLGAWNGAPGLGLYWEASASHTELPRGSVVQARRSLDLSEIIAGPSHSPDGTTNLFGGLRAAIAMCGYASPRDFHNVDVIVTD